MPEVKVGNTQFYYEIHGEGEPLALLQGFTLDCSYWQGLLPKLSKHFKVIILDHRDVGRTVSDGTPYTINDMADDVVGLTEALSVRRFHVLGFSMGGFIAQSLALRYPQKIQSLILAGTSQKANGRTRRLIETWVELMAHLPRRLALKEQLLWVYGDSFYESEKAMEKTLDAAMALPEQSVEQMKRQAHASEAWDFSEQKSRIVSPTLILAGSDDRLFSSRTEITDFAKLIPGAKLEIIEGAGHEFIWEEPGIVEMIVKVFCQSNSFAQALPPGLIPISALK